MAKISWKKMEDEKRRKFAKKEGGKIVEKGSHSTSPVLSNKEGTAKELIEELICGHTL